MPNPPTPYFAYVEMDVNGYNLTPIPPEHLMDFSYTHAAAADMHNLGSGTALLFDQTAIDVEFALHNTSQYPPQISFRFGYSETDIKSEVYTLSVQSYDFELTPGGARLTLTLTTGLDYNPITYAANTNENNIKEQHEINEEIIEKSEIYKVSESYAFEATDPIWIKGDDADGNEIDSHPSVHVKNEQAFTAATNALLEASRAHKDLEANFVINVKDTPENPEAVITSREEIVEEEEPIREYTYPFAKDGTDEAISFTAKVDTAMMMCGGGTIEALAFDEETHEPIIIQQDKDTNPQKRLVVGEETHFESTGATRLLNVSSGNLEMLKNKANFLWGRSIRSNVTATMVTLGDPDLDVFKLVIVNVLTPSGVPHHTTGIYMIMNITQNISGGVWTTTLDLWRQPVQALVEQPGRVIKAFDSSGGKNPFNPYGDKAYGPNDDTSSGTSFEDKSFKSGYKGRK